MALIAVSNIKQSNLMLKGHKLKISNCLLTSEWFTRMELVLTICFLLCITLNSLDKTKDNNGRNTHLVSMIRSRDNKDSVRRSRDMLIIKPNSNTILSRFLNTKLLKHS